MIKKISCNGQPIEYTLERKRVKNINLRVRPEGTVYVSAPYFTPQYMIDRFVHANGQRIISAIEQINKNSQAVAKTADSMVLRGEPYPLRIVPGRRDSAEIMADHVLFTLREPEDKDSFEKAEKKLLRRVAEERVKESSARIYPLFRSMGISQPEIKFRAMKSRWGSCRYDKGSLSFNTALAHVPDGCVDYVVMHEYCHFIHPNHSAHFYALMTRLMPDWKARKKMLEKYSPLL